MLFKDGDVVEAGAVVAALNDMDDRLKDYKGHIGEIGPLKAIVEETQKQVADALRVAGGGGRGGKSRFRGLTPEMRAKLSFEVMHKAPVSKPERIGPGLANEPDEDDVVSSFQRDCDYFYVFCAQMGMVDKDGRILAGPARATKYYKEVFLPKLVQTREFMVKEAFDTADAGAGLEYVPTEHSSRLFDLVQLEPSLSNYFEQIPMARNTQDFPSWLDDLLLAAMPERVLDGYDASTVGRAPDMLGSRSVTGLITFTAKKTGGIVFTSKEVEEDSIVPMLPLLQRKVILACRRANDTLVLNGDTTATHMDTDTAAGASTLVEKLDIGLRKDALTGTAIKNAEGNTITTDAAWNDYIRGVLPLMGAYKSKGKSNLLRILSGVVETQIGSVPKFATMYANGGRASNQGGDAGYGMFPDGIECYESEFARDDLNVNAVNGASGNDFTAAITVFKPAWAWGVRREIRLEASKERWFEFDLDAIKVTQRRTFKKVLTVGNPTAITRNIGL